MGPSVRLRPIVSLCAALLGAGPAVCLAALARPAAAADMTTAAAAVRAAPAPAVVRLRIGDLPLPPAALRTHTVRSGDTLWDIATAAGVPVSALAAANRIEEDALLRPGQVLRIPGPGEAGKSAARAAASRAQVSRAGPPLAQRLRLLWPSSGTVTSRFGWRTHPIFGGREFHTGMDIATRWGSPVLAARGGVVRFVGWKSGYGQMIVMDHGQGIETAYSHLSAAVVTSGQRVAPGQQIGRIGSTGWSTGPHLLFEVRRNGVPVDPSGYLN